MFGNLEKLVLGGLVAGALALAGSGYAQPKICVDPGHGGSDPGATGGGLQEKAIVLDTGLKLRTWLNLDSQDSGGGGTWNVIMTRTTDVFVSLSARTNFANNQGANRFMSIHANAFTSSSANGIETFSHPQGSSASHNLRNRVYEEAILMWPLTPRGTKTANFHVLRETNMPAELHEMAFVTNAGDRVYLGNATHRNNHARSEMFGLQRHYGIAKYTPGSQVVLTTDDASSNFTPGNSWWSTSVTPGYWGSGYHVASTEAVSDVSTFHFNVPSSGNYLVQAWWVAGANRSATAPYFVDHTNGPTVVHRNQQINGSQWRSLGTFHFGAGTRTVRLSKWTTPGYYVIADAVRLTSQ